MDEIITRWATDLSKYQKDFKEQAAKVAEWDRMLVENGEKIQKLYTSTYEAERASSEIERQLSNVESQQEELTAWLDRYERDLDELFTKQVGTTEQVAGPDQERERTYKLAEKLTDRLDDMGKDLTKMIKEINDMSSSLSKGSKPDDPVRLVFYATIAAILCEVLDRLTWDLADPDCPRFERPSVAAAVDRLQCCCAPGQGKRRSEGWGPHGCQRLGSRDRCRRELLPVIQGRVQIKG